MNTKRKNGQFFTVSNPFNTIAFQEWFESIQGDEITVLEPFAGSNNIVNLVNEVSDKKIHWVSYDIDTSFENNAPSVPIIQRDTILNYPEGFNIVITNPPYLAKNSATRRKLPFPETEYDDLYKHCLKIMLDNSLYVAAIIPESFITSGLFIERLSAVVSLTCKMFDDTECPVCLALFGPTKTSDFVIYKMNKKLGNYIEISKKVDKLFKKSNTTWKFNDPNGKIGIRCVDNNKSASIEFVHGDTIPASEIKVSSRALTRISGGDIKDIDTFLEKCNNVLSNYRAITEDVFLTSFKGLRDDGYYRRRLDFKTAKKILNTAMEEEC